MFRVYFRDTVYNAGDHAADDILVSHFLNPVRFSIPYHFSSSTPSVAFRHCTGHCVPLGSAYPHRRCNQLCSCGESQAKRT